MSQLVKISRYLKIFNVFLIIYAITGIVIVKLRDQLPFSFIRMINLFRDPFNTYIPLVTFRIILVSEVDILHNGNDGKIKYILNYILCLIAFDVITLLLFTALK
jgi:hypothetical protein